MLKKRILGRFTTPPIRAVQPPDERRASKRIRLPLMVRLSFAGSEPQPVRLRDISARGIGLEGLVGNGQPGEFATILFDGYPGVCEPFRLVGAVVRVMREGQLASGVRIDRHQTEPEALACYRQLVLHYIRHRPLLESVGQGFFEGRCEECNWLGRVGARRPRCAVCGSSKVTPIGQGSSSA